MSASQAERIDTGRAFCRALSNALMRGGWQGQTCVPDYVDVPNVHAQCLFGMDAGCQYVRAKQ